MMTSKIPGTFVEGNPSFFPMLNGKMVSLSWVKFHEGRKICYSFVGFSGTRVSVARMVKNWKSECLNASFTHHLQGDLNVRKAHSSINLLITKSNNDS